MTKKIKTETELLELEDINQLGRNFSFYFSYNSIKLMFVNRGKLLPDCQNRAVIFL